MTLKLTYNNNNRTWPRWCQDEPAGQISRSEVTLIKSSHRQTRTQPIALSGPPRWQVVNVVTELGDWKCGHENARRKYRGEKYGQSCCGKPNKTLSYRRGTAKDLLPLYPILRIVQKWGYTVTLDPLTLPVAPPMLWKKEKQQHRVKL